MAVEPQSRRQRLVADRAARLSAAPRKPSARAVERAQHAAAKGQGPLSRGTVAIDVSHIRAGDQCGFGTFGKYSGHIAVGRSGDGRLTLTMRVIEDVAADKGTTQKTDVRVDARPVTGQRLFLRTDMDFKTDRASVAYSHDGRDWQTLGGDFPLAFDWRTGTFQGQQYALFCYNPGGKGGWMDVDGFTLSGR
ncbi:hypothetical protein P0F65_07725 [Sphingomonas sp. I4]